MGGIKIEIIIEIIIIENVIGLNAPGNASGMSVEGVIGIVMIDDNIVVLGPSGGPPGIPVGNGIISVNDDGIVSIIDGAALGPSGLTPNVPIIAN